MSTSTTSNSEPLMLDQLELRVTGTIVVMICRKWDVNSATIQHLSTDFIVSDEKMDGDTIVHRSAVKPDGFARYPFQLVEFDSLEPTNNKYLIDAVGYVTNVGRTTTTRSGSKTLDFHLANNRGQSVRVTLWGGLGEMLIEKCTRHVRLYPVVLTALSVKLYNNMLYLSSTSPTMIVDDEQIPVWKTVFKSMIVRCTNLGVAIFKIVKIELVIFSLLTKKGWNYPSCGGEKCKKGNLDRKHGHFWCNSCHNTIWGGLLEFRMMTAQLVVMLRQTSKWAVVIMLRRDEEETGLPPALANMLGHYSHNLELILIRITNTQIIRASVLRCPLSIKAVNQKAQSSISKERHDSDGEESFMADSKTKGSDVGCSSGTGKRRRLVLDGSE
ncbi:reverse transcriptase domain-containing protein [Tanacetum coccineum]|uniref:Reverse transcriptase domain-containing protein n=1 Tax=Tanacetum coccineum TaxID=301880 RepID=A0ABQ5GG07_9ASTR